MSELNEGRHQVKRKYGDHGRIRINENGAKVRETIVKFVGKNYVTEEDLHNHLIRLEEDRGGVKVNKAKWFARNQKLFTTFEKKGTTYYSLSKYGMRVLELINSKTMKKALNESSFKNIPSLSEWIATNESEVNEQAISAASKGVETGQRGTDEEYKLLGMVKWYLNHDVIGKQIKSGGLKPKNDGIPDFDAMKASFDKRQDLMLESKTICHMGQILFEYLFEDGLGYKEHHFNEIMNIMSQYYLRGRSTIPALGMA